MVMDEVKRSVESAIELAQDGRYEEALRIFDEDLCFTQSPAAMAYYAYCLANVEANYDKAVSLCILAAEKEFYNPEIYFNLGRIFLLNGQKSVAIKAFRKGLKFDDDNSAIVTEIRKLGVRRRPVLTFLPRQNFLNRLFGVLAYRLSQPGYL